VARMSLLDNDFRWCPGRECGCADWGFTIGRPGRRRCWRRVQGGIRASVRVRRCRGALHAPGRRCAPGRGRAPGPRCAPEFARNTGSGRFRCSGRSRSCGMAAAMAGWMPLLRRVFRCAVGRRHAGRAARRAPLAVASPHARAGGWWRGNAYAIHGGHPSTGMRPKRPCPTYPARSAWSISSRSSGTSARRAASGV